MTLSRRPYATDLTDAEWQLLAPLIPPPKPGGRPPIHDRRELVNAIAFRHWRQQGLWEQIHRVLHVQERLREGRRPTPSAAILDSQSVKTTERGGRTATTAPRSSTAESATCWSTPSAWSARSR